MTAALLAASRGNHSDIVKCILLMDLSVLPKTVDKMEDLACTLEVKYYIKHTVIEISPLSKFLLMLPTPTKGVFYSLAGYSHNVGFTVSGSL